MNPTFYNFAGSQFFHQDNIDPALLALTPGFHGNNSSDFNQDVNEAAPGAEDGPPIEQNDYEWQTVVSGHGNSRNATAFASQPSSDRQWQSGNRFASLDDTELHRQGHYPAQLYGETLGYGEPAHTSYTYGLPDVNNGNLLHPANQGIPPSIAEWTEDVYYHPGMNLLDSNQAPLTPAASARGNRRLSITPSGTTAQTFECSSCEKSFEKRGDLNHHERWHEYPTHTCTCGKSFVAPKDLRRHRKIHDKAQRHLLCNIIGCKYHEIGFARWDHLKRHNLKLHPGNLLSPPTTISGGSRA